MARTVLLAEAQAQMEHSVAVEQLVQLEWVRILETAAQHQGIEGMFAQHQALQGWAGLVHRTPGTVGHPLVHQGTAARGTQGIVGHSPVHQGMAGQLLELQGMLPKDY